MMLMPDELQADIYESHVRDSLKKGAALASRLGSRDRLAILAVSQSGKPMHRNAVFMRRLPPAYLPVLFLSCLNYFRYEHLLSIYFSPSSVFVLAEGT